MYESHPLTEAARYNDAQAEELGFTATLESIGVELGPILHVARQRALRAVILSSRGIDGMGAFKSATPQEIALTADEDAQVEFLAAAYADGISLGWRAHQIDSRGDQRV